MTSDFDLETASIFYTNYVGFYDSLAYTNALAIYGTIEGNINNLIGSPVLTIDTLFNDFELMSDPETPGDLLT